MILSTSTNICAFTKGSLRNSIAYCIRACAQAGYTDLDVNLCEAMNPDSALRFDKWEAYVESLRREAEKSGVVFSQSHLPYYDVFACQDEHKRALMEELIRRSIIATGMLGAKWAVTHPCTVYEAGQDMSVSLERNLQYYSGHLDNARACGVGIALENDFEYKTKPYQRIFCASVYELCALTDAFSDDRHVGICYDFGHAHMTGGAHRQNLNAIGHRLRAVHVADNHGLSDEHLMPFYGTIDWEDAMTGLADIGFEGPLTYEIQEFGRNFPNEHKHLVIEQSQKIGQILIGYYEGAKQL